MSVLPKTLRGLRLLLTVCGAFFLLLLLPAGAARAQVQAQTFVVNSTDDASDVEPGDGECRSNVEGSPICTLRAALEEANANTNSGAVDVIAFDIPGTAPFTIVTFSISLPSVAQPVRIDATTQPGYDGTPLIEIYGGQTGNLGSGIDFDSGSEGSEVLGLSITGFPGYGINVNADSVRVAGCYVGVDPDGNADGNGISGVYLLGVSGVTIGGTELAARNVISGNNADGIGIYFGSSNEVLGNYIGVSPDGMTAMGNGNSGIALVGTATDNVIGGTELAGRNVISGNNGTGVRLQGDGEGGVPSENTIEGNYIGLSADGASALGNGFPDGAPGIALEGEASRNVIGGTAAGARNVISGNNGAGVHIEGDDNEVLGNYIGTDAAGTTALGNEEGGVVVDRDAAGNVIGGTTAGARNVISGNEGPGIVLDGSGDGIFPSENTIIGNYIGTDAGGIEALGNDGAGIEINVSASSNIIGGVDPGAANRIAFNQADGVQLSGFNSRRNAVRGNEIFSNVDLGIDLEVLLLSLTANDPGDADEGPNRFQNFPEIVDLSYSASDNELTVTYRVPTNPQNATYPLTVDFYRADVDAQEGEAYLGTDTYTASDFIGGPETTITLVPQVELAPGDSLVATATDAAGNTSEFSPSFAPADPIISVTPNSLDFGEVAVDVTARDMLTITNTGGLDLEITGFGLSGSAAYAITDLGPEGPVPPGGTRAVEVEFTPPDSGLKEATLEIQSTTGVESVPLSGVGIAPEIVVEPVSLDFGAVIVGETARDTVTITSTGTADLEITNVSISGPDAAAFSIAGGGGPGTLPPGEEREVVVAFAPDTAGAKTATLAIESNAGPPETVALSGQGQAPPAVTIEAATDVTANGATLNGTVNPGGAETTVTFEYGVTEAYGDTIEAQQSPLSGTGDQAVSAALTGLDLGTTYHYRAVAGNAAGTGAGADRTFTTAAPVLTVEPASLDFGGVAVGETAHDTLTITNTGTAALEIVSSLSITGSEAFEVVSGGESGTLLPGEEREVAVAFTPTTAGEQTATLTVESSVGNAEVGLVGTGHASGLVVSPTSADFDTVLVGTRAEAIVTVTSTGNVELTVSPVELTGPDAEAFRITGGGDGGVLAPGEELDVTLAFAPAASGGKTATLRIGSTAGTREVALRGAGVQAGVEVRLPQGSVSQDQPITVEVIPSEGFIPSERALFYRPVGVSGYAQTVLEPSGRGFSGTIPAEAVTGRGVELYVRLAAGGVVVTVPAENPKSRPLYLPVQVEEPLTARGSFQPVTYGMVSVPLVVEDPAPLSVLVDDYGQYDPDRWRLLRWNADAQRYRELPDLDAAFTPGTAFWLITEEGQGFDVEGGRSVDASAPQTITLKPGWNQIANPFAFAVAWSAVTVGDVLVTESAGVERPAFFDGVEYRRDVQRLRPWEGYFVFNRGADSLVLSVPAKEAVEASGERVVSSEQGYVLQVKARLAGTKLRDTQNFLGFSERATGDEDGLDFREAPGIGARLSVSIVDEEDRRWAGSYKPHGGEGARWDLELGFEEAEALFESGRPAEVEVELVERGTRPARFGIYVWDVDQGRRVVVRDGRFSLNVDPDASEAPRRIRVAVGTEAFAEASRPAPSRFALEAAFPNPFSRKTTLRYQLKTPARVVLEVFDMLGRRVRTLVDAEQAAGAYDMVWDGGKSLAGGMYFVRLRAGDFTAVRRVILVR